MDKFYVNNKDAGNPLPELIEVVCPELYHLATVQHKEKYEQLKAEIKRLKEALEHILEYWNGDRNDTAMHDALWHILDTANETLKGE